jgi:hypothetical protein
MELRMRIIEDLLAYKERRPYIGLVFNGQKGNF